jgi:fructoselysine-6-P-deglycase FrlB-like protein
VTKICEITDTALWRDALETPQTVATTLDTADGHADLVRLLKTKATRRVVATGNGASWYVASAFWLATLTTPVPCSVIAVPAGVLATGGFAWRPGDLLLAFSSSGELRDLIDVVLASSALPVGLVTASADSSLSARASAQALVSIWHQRAVTHTQAYVGAAAVAFELLGRWAGNVALRSAARRAPDVLSAQLAVAPAWAESAAADLSVTRAGLVFGKNQAWFAALQAALLLKEVAGIPAEGMEVREAATTGIYALNVEDLVLTLPVGEDSVADEAEAVCAKRGGIVRRAPWPLVAGQADALFGHFAHPLALSIRLALDRGREPDNPGWWAAYEATARRVADRAPLESASDGVKSCQRSL